LFCHIGTRRRPGPFSIKDENKIIRVIKRDAERKNKNRLGGPHHGVAKKK
jgi:hypothetical protein